MLERALLSAACLALAGCLAAAPAAEPAPLTASAAPDGLVRDGIYYAPVDDSPAAAAALPGASTLSRAHVTAFAWGHPERDLDDVEIFVGGESVGRTPLTLDGVLVPAAGLSVGARKDGYEESLRPRVLLPVDGPVRVALLPEDSGRAVTLPGWVAGLGLAAAGLLVYRSDDNAPGLALAGGGLLTVAATQAWQRWFSLPALRAKVDAYNRGNAPAPPL